MGVEFLTVASRGVLVYMDFDINNKCIEAKNKNKNIFWKRKTIMLVEILLVFVNGHTLIRALFMRR